MFLKKYKRISVVTTGIILLFGPAFGAEFKKLSERMFIEGRNNIDIGIKHATEALNKWTPADGTREKSIVFGFRGDMYHTKQLYDNAISDYTESIRLNKKNAISFHGRASAYLRKALRNVTLDSDSKSKLYDKALDDETEALRLGLHDTPYSYNAFFQRGEIYFIKRLYDKAVEDFTKGLELKPNVAHAWGKRGSCYVELGVYDKAIEDYSKNIELDGANFRAIHDRGVCYFFESRFDDAIADFSNAIKLDLTLNEGYLNRAASYLQKGLYDKAIEDFKKSIALDPTTEYSVAYLGFAYFLQGNYNDAIESFNKVTAINRESPLRGKAYWQKILVYKEMKNNESLNKTLQEAQRYLEEQINKHPNVSSNFSDLALIYAEARTNIEGAVELAETATRISPNFENYCTLGFVYHKKNDLQKVGECLRKAREYMGKPSEKFPLNGWNWNCFRLSRAYEEIGDIEKARKIWKLN